MSAGGAGLFVAASALLFPDPGIRESAAYLAVLPLGYGHLLGALLYSRRRLARGDSHDVRGRFVAGVVALDLFAAYSFATAALGPVFLLPLLAISAWHTLENDLALARAREGCLGLGPLPRDAAHHLSAFGGTALLLLLASTSPDAPQYAAWFAVGAHGAGVACLRAACIVSGAALCFFQRGTRRVWQGAVLAGAGAVLESPGLTLGDVVAGSTLYHVLSWLLFSIERLRGLRQTRTHAARRLAWRLAWIHVLPLAVCLGVYASSAGWLAPLRLAVVAPSIYLFWSVLHVFQTVLSRGLEPRPA